MRASVGTVSGRRARTGAAFAAFLMALVALPLAQPVGAAVDAPAETTRLRGADRFETAANAARDAFPQGAATAVMARGDDFPDALAGSYVAGLQGAGGSPILLTLRDRVPPATRAALTDLGVRSLVLLGGDAAISAAVEAELRGMGLEITRIAGANRFDTARRIAESGGSTTIGTVRGGDGRPRRTAIVASGLGFADALSAGPLSFAGRLPVLLTAQARLSEEAQAALQSLGIQQVFVVGGRAAVSDAVAEAIGALGIEVRRISGAERTETAVRVAELTINLLGWTLTGNRSQVNLATGQNFPDALALGPRAARNQSVIVLAQAGDLLGDATEGFIGSSCAGIRRIVVAGGTAAVADDPVERASRVANCQASVQFVWVSDWHAQIDPLTVSGRPVGGAPALSAYWQEDRAAFDGRSITLTAGDAYGASPPLSGFFGERPGVLAQRMMGFDIDTFGNHNFDGGIDHLQQMVDLAAAPTGPDTPGTPFRYVSANLRNRDDNLRGVQDYAIFDVDGVRMAVIGLTNEEAPGLVFPSSFGTIEVTDSVEAANRARDAARAEGAEVFVVITHKGVTGTDAQGNETGPLIDFANAVQGFHVIFGDHTDWEFEGLINGQLVLENRSKGRTYGKTTLTVDRRNPAVQVTRTHQFITPWADEVDEDEAIVGMLEPFRDLLAEAFDGEVGVATDTFVRGGNIERREEVAIGNLVTDAIRERFGTQLAFTNGGGIRAPLPSSYEPQDTSLRRPPAQYADGPPWDLVVGDIFEVLPFGNAVVTREVTGAQLWEMLENGVSQVNPDGSATDGRFPQISGFRFSYSSALPAGSRVQSVTFPDGTPIPADGTVYSLATNDFVDAGGDGYAVLSDTPETSVTREIMFDVVAEHIESLGTITPTTEGRITRTNA